jgi:hypothetical protein
VAERAEFLNAERAERAGEFLKEELRDLSVLGV